MASTPVDGKVRVTGHYEPKSPEGTEYGAFEALYNAAGVPWGGGSMWFEGGFVGPQVLIGDPDDPIHYAWYRSFPGDDGGYHREFYVNEFGSDISFQRQAHHDFIGTTALPPVAFGAGYVQAGAASDDGGLWLQFMAEDLAAPDAVFDVPEAPSPVFTPIWLTATQERVFVFVRETDPDREVATLGLRVYDDRAALLSAASLAAFDPAAVSVEIVDVAVTTGGAIYVLGEDRLDDDTTLPWLRRIAR